MQRGGFGRSNNYGIGMNPLGTIGNNYPYVTSQESFKFFFRGASDFSNRSMPLLHDASIIENPVCDIIFKNSGRKNYF